jgi:hypothetical protein
MFLDHCIPGGGAILIRKFRMSWKPSRTCAGFAALSLVATVVVPLLGSRCTSIVYSIAVAYYTGPECDSV